MSSSFLRFLLFSFFAVASTLNTHAKKSTVRLFGFEGYAE